MPIEEVPPSLQESILAALTFDERHGKIIAGQVTASLFDEGYREIAERVLNYWRKYRKPPGRAHLDDMFGKLLQPGRAPRMRRLVFDLAELAGSINGEYVVARTQEYVRQQKQKAALIEANSRFEQGGEGLADDIDAIFSKASKFRAQTMERGTFLNDTARSLAFFDRAQKGISFGIGVLDTLGLRLTPQEQTLYIAPKGSGKSWKCVHVGVQGLIEGKRVVHLSLEMPEEQVTGRYYQRVFAAAMRPDKYMKSYLEFDERLERLSGFRSRLLTPNWSFSEAGAKRELKRRIQGVWGQRFGNLVVKNFPSGQLTIPMLEGYLDYLELEERFVPHLMIVDYPDLMKQDAKNLRISLGQTFVDLRGIAGTRNMALFTPTQSGRDTIGGRRTRSSDATEDISKVFTADQTFSYQQTEAEKARGLARLSIEHARGVADGTMIVITQSYSTGQYALQSALMQAAYWDRLNEVTEGRRDADDSDIGGGRRLPSSDRRSLPKPNRRDADVIQLSDRRRGRDDD